ncbi:MAG: hypothetical protein HUJ51_04985 [Eggerthellaceae bacterium]|nr:hypothetical protein [Eggerthellaceae bacterium]
MIIPIVSRCIQSILHNRLSLFVKDQGLGDVKFSELVKLIGRVEFEELLSIIKTGLEFVM